MSTPTRFSDGQYKNWLKCSLSLIIMKEALHDYTENEVKNLHDDITQKVSSILCASSTVNQCGSCFSTDIFRGRGNPRKWSINCNNNICNIWLKQILDVHNDRHNPSINWKNADVSLWPIDRYQVAKIFMPKGQHKTVKMPDELDAPAILSLLKYCKCFSKNLPNPLIPSDLIDIRNKLLHSGEMRVVDGDKDNWINLMKQLLSDLNIRVDTQAELEKLKKEDIDINFRENEIKVFERMTSDLASELSTLKEDMASMQKSQSEVMEKVNDSKTETTKKMDALEADMEIFRKSLHEHGVICEKVVFFLDKHSIHDSEIIKNITSIEMDIGNLRSDLTRVEKELKARVSSLEKQCEETNVEIKGIKEREEETKVEIKGIKESVEEIQRRPHSLQTETTGNKIPDSEGLRILKTCGVPEFSSAKSIHQSRSSNAVLEGTGDKYNNTSNLISSMSSVSLQVTKYVLKEHFDACIIYCEADETDAYGFKDQIEKLDLGNDDHPKICLYTEEKVWGPIKLTERAKFVCTHCTLIFVYLSKRSSLDEYADFFRNEVVMATITNCKVRPVLSEEGCIIPWGLKNAPRIEWYKQESRSYKENILSLFHMNKSERLRREAESIESILSTL